MTQEEFVRLCGDENYYGIRKDIKLGVDPNTPVILEGIYMTPLLAAIESGNDYTIEHLIYYGADYTDALMSAVASDQLDLVQFMYMCGADIDIQDEQNCTALLYAVKTNNYRAVKKLIKLGANVNKKIIDGEHNVLTYTVSMSEIRHKNPDSRIIKALMDAGSDYGEALLLAVRLENKRLITQLIRNGADINKRFGAYTPLAVAMLKTREAVNSTMIEFLAKYGANVNEVFSDDDGLVSTPLNISIDRPDIAQILLKYGANVNYMDQRGKTPLFYAALTGNKILRTLLSNGADPNQRDNDGRTPLMLALIDGENVGDVEKTLLKFGADPNLQDNLGMTALMWAIITKDRSPYFLINALIRTGGFRANGWKTWCALLGFYEAARRKVQLDNIKILLNNGADVRIKNYNGMTALSCAVTSFDDEISEMLIKTGAKTTKEN